MPTSVYALARDDHHANTIIIALQGAGFPLADLSLLFSNKDNGRDFSVEMSSKVSVTALSGAATGGAIGGALGWIAGIGLLIIPGLGPFVAAGPILSALGGMTVGAAAGSIGGTFVALGLPEIEAKHYDSKVRDGHVLVTVQVHDSAETATAERVLNAHGATDVGTSEAVPVVDESDITG